LRLFIPITNRDDWKANIYIIASSISVLIKLIGIKNYKSIVDDEIELGRINVFIGENGAGKSNILEAVAVLSAYLNFDLSVEGLFNRGVRVTKPKLMFNSFNKLKADKGISICSCYKQGKGSHNVVLTPLDPNDIYTKWNNENTSGNIPKNINSIFNQINDTNLLEQVLSKKDLLDNLNLEPDILNKMQGLFSMVEKGTDIVLEMGYQIYNLSTLVLRGINQNSKRQPRIQLLH